MINKDILTRYRLLSLVAILGNIAWWVVLEYTFDIYDPIEYRAAMIAIATGMIYLTYKPNISFKIVDRYHLFLSYYFVTYMFMLSNWNYQFKPLTMGAILVFLGVGMSYNTLKQLISYVLYTIPFIIYLTYTKSDDVLVEPSVLLLLYTTAIGVLIGNMVDRLKFIQQLKDNNKELDNRKLKAISQAKYAELGQMAAKMAHEINNPLAVIKGMNTIIKRKCANPEVKLKFDKIDKSVDRIVHIIKSLKKTGRTTQDQEEMQVVDLQKLSSESTDYFTQIMKRDSINFIVSNSIVSGAMVKCYEPEIMQIVVNLVNNASYHLIKYHEEGDRDLTVSMYTSQGKAHMSIANTGHIPDNVVDQLFNPFFTTKPVGEGTGIGLGLSKEIAKNHGGDLQLIQENNKIEFIVTLPIYSLT